MAKKERRLSASRVIEMNECSMKFYLKEFKNLPEKTWPRTIIGTVAHSVLEAIRRTKHKKHYDLIKEKGSIYASSSIARLVKIWQNKEKIAQELIDDVDAMVMLVINDTNFLDAGAIKTFDPEHEFLLKLPSGGLVKGFIDRLAEYEDKFKVTDYKSAREKFPKKKVLNSFQAFTYMLYIWKKFGKLAEVEFIMMRHPPTKRTPEKHLQVTKASSPELLDGFELYMDSLYLTLQNFDENLAKNNYCQDEGFCRNVCSYYRGFNYKSVKKKDTHALVKNYFVDTEIHLNDDEYVETLYFEGCPKFNVQN